MLTLDEFKALPFDEVFATGVLPNSPNGIFMTRDGGQLRWVAKKGRINDWAVYSHWACKSEQFVKESGDKIMTKQYIQNCVPCADEVMQLYRF